jgi:hypothetical protein
MQAPGFEPGQKAWKALILTRLDHACMVVRIPAQADPIFSVYIGIPNDVTIAGVGRGSAGWMWPYQSTVQVQSAVTCTQYAYPGFIIAVSAIVAIL